MARLHTELHGLAPLCRILRHYTDHIAGSRTASGLGRTGPDYRHSIEVLVPVKGMGVQVPPRTQMIMV